MSVRDWRGPANIEVDGDRLYGTTGGLIDRNTSYKPVHRCCISLSTCMMLQLEIIRDYARKWGVLWICKHNLPTTHNPPPAGSKLSGQCL